MATTTSTNINDKRDSDDKQWLETHLQCVSSPSRYIFIVTFSTYNFLQVDQDMRPPLLPPTPMAASSFISISIFIHYVGRVAIFFLSDLNVLGTKKNFFLI